MFINGFILFLSGWIQDSTKNPQDSLEGKAHMLSKPKLAEERGYFPHLCPDASSEIMCICARRDRPINQTIGHHAFTQWSQDFHSGCTEPVSIGSTGLPAPGVAQKAVQFLQLQIVCKFYHGFGQAPVRLTNSTIQR